MSANLGLALPSPPADGISNLRFSLSSDLLLAPSWDGVSLSKPYSLPWTLQNAEHSSLKFCCSARGPAKRQPPYCSVQVYRSLQLMAHCKDSSETCGQLCAADCAPVRCGTVSLVRKLSEQGTCARRDLPGRSQHLHSWLEWCCQAVSLADLFCKSLISVLPCHRISY